MSRALTRCARNDILECIVTIRGVKAILDSDLASIYGVEVRRLNEQVKRNIDRFPNDFSFVLSESEWQELGRLRSQNATLKRGGHRKHIPRAFTEHGALMAANVLRSPQAVEMSVFVVRTFVRLREMVAGHADLVKRIEDMEKRYDKKFSTVFEAIRALISSQGDPARRIGFRTVRNEGTRTVCDLHHYTYDSV